MRLRLGFFSAGLAVAAGACSPPAAAPATNQAMAPLDANAEFLRAANGDPWARPPASWANDGGERRCARVTEDRIEEATHRLEQISAIRLTADEARRLTGIQGTGMGAAYLLRGFASNNSTARVLISGRNVIVESDSLGGLFRLRRHPCVAWLDRAPAQVFTFASYDI